MGEDVVGEDVVARRRFARGVAARRPTPGAARQCRSVRGAHVLFLAAAWCAVLCGTGCAPTSLPPIVHAAVEPPAAPDVELETGLEIEHDGAATAIDLRTALEEAATRSPQVVLAEARLRRAAGLADQAASGFLPSLELGARARGLFGRVIGTLGVQQDDTGYVRFDPAVSLFYRINVGGQASQTIAASEERDAAELTGRDMRRRALLAAGRAYLDLVLANASVTVADRLVEDAERLERLASVRFETGVASAADVARTEGEAAMARQARAEATVQRTRASMSLALLLGRPLDSELAPSNGVPVLALVGIEAASMALERPDVEASESLADAASSRASAAWWEAFGPEIDAGLTAGLTGLDIADLAPRLGAWVWLGLRVSVEEIQAARTAEAQVDIRRAERDDRRRRAEAEARSAAATLRGATESLPHARQSLEALTRAHRMHFARFEAGAGNALSVLEAQQALARARLAMIAAVLRYDAAQLELLAALGRLTPGAVREQHVRTSP